MSVYCVYDGENDDVQAYGLLCEHKKLAVFRTAGEHSASDMTLWLFCVCVPLPPAMGTGLQQRKEQGKRQTCSSLILTLTLIWTEPDHAEVSEKTEKQIALMYLLLDVVAEMFLVVAL